MDALGRDLDAARRDVDSLRLPPGARAPNISASGRAALEAAVSALPSIDVLTETIRIRLLESWPVFADTPELERELRDTIDCNLRQYFGKVILSDGGDTLVAPAEALTFAISVQHHGIDTAVLIQAYRVGQNIAWSWWMEHLARELSDHALLMEVISRSSQRMFAYVDAVVAEQVRLWEHQRERWSGHLISQRTEAVRRLLEGETSTPQRAAREIGYKLDRQLVAGVLWESPSASLRDAPGRMSRLELTAEAIVNAVGGARVLVIPAEPACIWAWFALDADFDVDTLERGVGAQLHDGQGLALSIPGRGLEGFRAGHRQALRAQRFAELSQGARGVVRFDEVETLCVMSEDPELLAEFVARKLGPLAATSSSARRLRETLLVWLREGGSASRAAECLRTHKNTVRNRVQRAEELLGRPLEDDRLGLELALTVLQRVGSRG